MQKKHLSSFIFHHIGYTYFNTPSKICWSKNVLSMELVALPSNVIRCELPGVDIVARLLFVSFCMRAACLNYLLTGFSLLLTRDPAAARRVTPLVYALLQSSLVSGFILFSYKSHGVTWVRAVIWLRSGCLSRTHTVHTQSCSYIYCTFPVTGPPCYLWTYPHTYELSIYAWIGN